MWWKLKEDRIVSKLNITYQKIYSDDSGKHTQNIFGSHNPVSVSYKRLWKNIVDGFFVCKNSDILIMATEGNMRVVVVCDREGHKFEQYFISELDGKVLYIPSGTKYGIQNMDEGKSSFLIGSYEIELDFEYSNKSIFNWRKKTP